MGSCWGVVGEEGVGRPAAVSWGRETNQCPDVHHGVDLRHVLLYLPSTEAQVRLDMVPSTPARRCGLRARSCMGGR